MDRKNTIVCWIIWFAFFQAAFIYHFLLGDGFPSGENIDTPLPVIYWVLALTPLAIATGIRWAIIPKISEGTHLLVAMIIGMSLCEATIFFEIFLIGPDYPQYQIAILIVAVFASVQFAPTYTMPEFRKE